MPSSKVVSDGYNRIPARWLTAVCHPPAHPHAEDNEFISVDPTAYINLSGEGRNMYYARNRHGSQFVHQSDFSFTFDGQGGAYLGKVAARQRELAYLGRRPDVSQLGQGETRHLAPLRCGDPGGQRGRAVPLRDCQ